MPKAKIKERKRLPHEMIKNWANLEATDFPSYYHLRVSTPSPEHPNWIKLDIYIQNIKEQSVDCLGHLSKDKAREFVALWVMMGNSIDGENIKEVLS